MAKAALVDSDITAGAELVEDLDQHRLKPTAAFWFYFPDDDIWRLFLGVPLLYEEDLSRAYADVIAAMNELEPIRAALTVDDIVLVLPTHPIIQMLSLAILTGPDDLAGIRFTRNVINRVLIEDAYIFTA